MLTVNKQSGAILWGDNNWYTLDYLQAAVAKKTGKQMRHGDAFHSANEEVQIVGNCDYDEMAKALGPELEAIEMRQHMTSREEHLPLPRMNFKSSTSQQPTPKQTFNEGDEQHLIPPKFTFQRRD